MLVCPVCKTKAKDENQEYCLTCAWEFEYYFDELSMIEEQKYQERMIIYKRLYKKSKNEDKSKIHKISQANTLGNKGSPKRKNLLRLIVKWILIFIGISFILFIYLAVQMQNEKDKYHAQKDKEREEYYNSEEAQMLRKEAEREREKAFISEHPAGWK